MRRPPESPTPGNVINLRAVAAVCSVVAFAVLVRTVPEFLVAGPVIANAVAGTVFARSLRSGSTPLIVRFAQIERGTVPADLYRHLAVATRAWAVLLFGAAVAQAVVSLAVPRWAFAVFSFVVVPTALVALFVGEWVLRRRRLPHHDHSGLLAQVRLVVREWPAVIGSSR